MGERLEKLSSNKASLIVILALCLVLRLGLAYYQKDADAAPDAYNYVHIAMNIADGKGFAIDSGYGRMSSGEAHPTAYGDPIYPAFLAAIYYVTGDDGTDPLPVSIVQSLIDTLTCFLVFILAVRFTSRRSIGLIAASIYAIYPPFILSTATAMTETLTVFLTLVAIYLLVQAFDKGVGRFVLAGAVMGVLILLKPAMLMFPFVAGLVLLLARNRVKGWAVKWLAYIAVAYIVVCLWTIRNYMVMHAFIPVASHGGVTLWGGTGPADGVCLGTWTYPLEIGKSKLYSNSQNARVSVSEKTYRKITKLKERLDKLGEVEQDKLLMQEAKAEIRQHPGRYTFLAIKKFFRLWFNLWDDLPPSWRSYAIAGFNAVLLLLAVPGYRRKQIDSNFRLVALALCVYTTVMSMLVLAHVRYSYPVMPYIIIFAAAFIGGAGKPAREDPDSGSAREDAQDVSLATA